MPNSFTNELPPFQAIALSLDNAPSNRAAKNIFHRQPQPGVRSGFRLGFLRFMAFAPDFRSRRSPVAFIQGDEGRYRIFFQGRYVGGLWTDGEIARVEACQPQNESELIQLLDCIAFESGLERSPP